MNPLQMAVLAALLSWLTGCAIVGSEPFPAAAGRPTLCLERHPNDDRNIGALVEASLRDHGFSVVTVAQGQCDPALPLRVGYVDSFGWDIRVFLFRLTVEVFDNRTGESLAIGESFQGTFAAMGDDYQDVAERAVGALLGKESS